MKRYISLFKALPYFTVLDDYFGQCLPGLAIMLSEIEMNGEEMDRNLRLTEYVSGPDIVKAFERAGIDTEREGFSYDSLIWLVCNMYYGDNYYEFTNAQESVDNGAYGAYKNIRTSAARLFVLLKRYTDARSKLYLEKEKIEKEWEDKTREHWRIRRAEIRLEIEREWGKDEVNGPDWKYVEGEIAKEADARLEREKESALHAQDNWKRVSSAQNALECVSLKIGGQSLNLESASWWFEELFSNHLFVHFLRDVKTVDQAKALYVKKAGKKPEDNRITAMVYGISKLFYDRGLVATKTQANLLPFILDIIRLMDLKNNAGRIPTLKQIEKMIENLPNAKQDPKFFSASLRPVSIEELMIDPVIPENGLGWLMSPSRN